MLNVKQIKVDVLKNSDIEIKNSISKKLKINISDILDYEIVKQSIDARDKNEILYVYELDIKLRNEHQILKKKYKDVSIKKKTEYKFECTGNKRLEHRPIIIGSGPAGLFAALLLAENNYRPIIIERGEKIEDRVNTVEEFFKTGKLNPNSNVQFGEGGAGTFSDGKLNTMVNDKNNRFSKVFKTFVECGANKDILYSYKPHIGTDILRKVIINLRNKIIELGGTFIYNTTLTDINIENKKIKSIVLDSKEILECDCLVLAIGHSARDTFKMLYDKNLKMEAKPFAIGLRVQHPQKMIDLAEYGEKYKNILNKSSYKLTYQASNGRGVYSFCMCPGGYVVNASSKNGYLAINGMSNYERESENANSAIVVTISVKDFGTNPLDGVKYQEELEKKTYNIGEGKIPVQLLEDFIANRKSTNFKGVNPIYKGEYTFKNLNDILPDYVREAIKEAFPNFGKKIKGFDRGDAILAGIESRTSSPVRIKRNDNFESNIEGIYPCGEGAGYAGGITSASIDGIKVAEAIGNKYKS